MLISLLFSCNAFRDGCSEHNVDLWCTDVSVDATAANCGTPTGSLAYQCGEYDVIVESGGFTGAFHYFDHRTGEHVATEFWTDTNSYCGGFVSWYGKQIDCEPTCEYAAGYDLPPCETDGQNTAASPD